MAGEAEAEAGISDASGVLLTLDGACALLREQHDLADRIKRDQGRLEIVMRQVRAMRHLLSADQWRAIDERIRETAAPGADGNSAAAGPGRRGVGHASEKRD